MEDFARITKSTPVETIANNWCLWAPKIVGKAFIEAQGRSTAFGGLPIRDLANKSPEELSDGSLLISQAFWMINNFGGYFAIYITGDEASTVLRLLPKFLDTRKKDAAKSLIVVLEVSIIIIMVTYYYVHMLPTLSP